MGRMKLGWRRILAAVLIVATVAVVAGATLFRLYAKDLFYGLIFPDEARLLEGHAIPDELAADDFRRDLVFLRTELPRLHVAFERAFPAGRLDASIAALEARAEELGSDRRRLELVGLLASGGTGTGHTMIVPLQRSLDWRIYPMSLWWFDDGLYVTAASARYAGAVGSRVVALGGVEAEEALGRLAPFVPSDNESSRRGNLPLLAGMAEALTALGLAAQDGTLTLDLQGQGGAARMTVQPVPLLSPAGLGWARTRQSAVEEAWSPADGRPRARPYVLRREPDGETLLLRLSQMRADEEEPFEALAKRLDRMAREEPPERFLVDLRANGGGNNELPRPLLETISDHPVLDRRGRLFVLVGRHTFSAAGNFAMGLERRTRALFVGEPTGFAPDHFGDARPILLPGSKLVARIASRFWQEDLPGVERAALTPDIAVPHLARHHFEDDDPAPKAIRAYQSRAATAERPPVAAGLPAGVAGSYLLSPHHRVRLFETDGAARLAIDEVGPFALLDLLGEPPRLATQRPGVHLELPEGGLPVLHWLGRMFELTPIDAGHRLPFEQVEAGEIAAGVAAYRQAAGAVEIGSAHELALTRIGYRMLREGSVALATDLFRLVSDLFPRSANSWDSLGDGLRASGDRAGAIEAYRQAVALHPLFEPSLRSLEELGQP